MKRGNPKRQRGAALLALLAVIMLGASWFLVSRLNAETATAAAIRKERNAQVLNRAKQALIGYVAAQAAKAFEDRPGTLPCPEAAGYFDSTTDDGKAASSCTLPKVGRFPWRTLGTEKLVDATGEPLWYVVSPGWAYTSGTGPVINSNSVGQLTVDGVATTPVASPGIVNVTSHGFAAGDSVTFTTGGTLPTGITAGTPYYVIAAGLSTNAFGIATTAGGSAINFTGTASGTHNVHRNPPGAANSVVALIIAPGSAFNVASATGCAAKSQARPTTGTPDWSNYLECENATYPTPDATFVTTGPSGSFNDQVMTITVADIMPGIEAAIANRIEREILPALQTVYTPATWGFTGTSPVTVNPVLPFAASFANPGPGAGTSDYVGATGTYRGLLPFYQVGCTQSVTNPRCALPTYAKLGTDTQTAGSGTIRTQSTCSWQSNDFVCIGEYLQPNISVTVRIKVYVTTGLRTTTQALPWTANSPVTNVTFTAMNDTTGGWGTQSIPHTVTASALGSDGSITFTIAGGALPDIATAGWGTYANYSVSINKAVFGDHALLDSTNATTGWFTRNEWYRLLYYEVSQGNTAAQLPSERSCSTPLVTCLTVLNMTPSTSKSVALILAGRSINGSARPSATLADYLEFNNANANGIFEKLFVPPRSSVNYSDAGAANAYSVPVASLAAGGTFQFKAANTNTASSTLTTTATGLKNLVNADSSNLTAAAIRANAIVEVVYDGTKFVLLKRPINDRFAVLSSN